MTGLPEKLPASQRAEEAVLGAILREPKVAGEVIGALLEPEHFYYAPYRVVYEEIVERYYGDDPMDPLTIAEVVSKKVAAAWHVEERVAVDRIIALSTESLGGESVTEHAALVKRHADYRTLLKLAVRLQEAVEREDGSPEEIAGSMSADAMRVATDSIVRFETLPYRELGRRFVRATGREIEAREAGVELGAYFEIDAIDDFTKGLRPTELCIAGGEPGVGKSAVWWLACENFAKRQMRFAEKRGGKMIGTLILSLEMGEQPSSTRLAQSVSGVDANKLREGKIERDELYAVAQRWAAVGDLPLYINHASSLRSSQLRAIVAEEIKRHNCGLVLIDHFKQIRPDDAKLTGNESDDEIVRFLKEGLAKDLNVAVICVAHTVKAIESQDRRPRANDLRGSGMIHAFADFISFVYRPIKHASRKDKERGLVTETEAEMIWEKSRNMGEGVGEMHLNLAKMTVR